MKQKKIIFFINDLNSGGIENYLLRFLRFKSDSFNAIVVYCKNGIGGQLEDDYLSIKNVRVVKNKINFFRRSDYLRLKSYLQDESFDVVCDFTGNFGGLILRQSRKAGIEKRIAFYRGSTNRFKSGLLKNIYNHWLNYLVKKNATNILSNSKAALEFFFTNTWQNKKSFEVIYNGVDPDVYLEENDDLRLELNIPTDAFVVGHTGRFNPAKNHKVIIEVAEFLVTKYENIYFILCGNGVDDNLRPYLKENRLDERILTFGNRRDIPRFLNTMNFFIFPSITEGQPNSLLEAMLMKLPFVASNINPIKETVGTDNSNRLFSPFDSAAFKFIIEEAYLQNVKPSYENRDYILNNFNHKLLFNKFFNVINNYSK